MGSLDPRTSPPSTPVRFNEDASAATGEPVRRLQVVCFLGAVWSIEPTAEAHAVWIATALTCWPYRPDWRL
jgi:hypothetical protein